MSKSQAAKRRRDVLLSLITAAAVSLLAGLLPGLGFMIAIHVTIDLVLAAFLTISARQVRMASDRARRVQFASRSVTQRPAMVRPRQSVRQYDY